MEQSFFQDKTGDPADRVDGKAKVTGAARYAAEYKPDGLTYGVLVTSTIAKGRIQLIDSKKAEAMPGVLSVLTHLNRPEVPGWDQPAGPEVKKRVKGQEFRVFYDDRIHFNHQPVALVIADTLERATDAARQVKVSYRKEQHQTDINNPSPGKMVNDQSVNREI
jgi:xanthine dehydrogenase YagR molybdenum-binding subunit